MCGITALISKEGNPENKNLISKVLDSFPYRGPDDDGIDYVDINEKVIFGHLRLSILDISKAGHQPMYDHSGRYVMIFNGEIYNYKEIKLKYLSDVKFKSGTDSEVLLELYARMKEKIFDIINGMFAIIIYDKVKDEIFFTRDRLGIKPLYICNLKDEILLCSEPKAAVISNFVNFEPNEEAIFDFLAFGERDHTDSTFFQYVKRIQPGTFGYIKKDMTIMYEEYWNIKNNQTKHLGNLKLEDIVDKVDELINDAIKYRLISDVPVGTSLSGGIDSSLVAALASKYHDNKFTSVSAIFEGEEVDESKFSRLIVKENNLRGVFTSPNPDEVIKELDNILEIQGEPIGSMSPLVQYFVMKEAKKNNLTVMLDGQGADELFAGYTHYIDTYFKELSGNFHWRKLYRKYKEHMAFSGKDIEYKNLIKIMLKGVLEKFLPQKIYEYRIKNNKLKLFKSGVFEKYYESSRVKLPKRLSLKENLLYSTTISSLPNLLMYEDRSSMAFSIEARVPYLDHNLVEFMASLKTDQIYEIMISKVILRKISERYIPEDIAWRRDKIGFAAPEKKWMRKLKKQIHNTLNENSWIMNFANFNYLNELFENFENLNVNEYRYIWRCYSVEWWYNKFSNS
tara:strand:- start:139 stop:2010 length:1872 start_codon:yes stop_codon:yes gene_type:complete